MQLIGKMSENKYKQNPPSYDSIYGQPPGSTQEAYHTPNFQTQSKLITLLLSYKIIFFKHLYNVLCNNVILNWHN